MAAGKKATVEKDGRQALPTCCPHHGLQLPRLASLVSNTCFLPAFFFFLK